MDRRLLAFLAASATALAACGPGVPPIDSHPERVSGAAGRVSFWYDAFATCSPVCTPVDNALAVGATPQPIDLLVDAMSSASRPVALPESAGTIDPAIATAVFTGQSVVVTPAAAGMTDLVLVDGRGGEVDRLSLRVAEVAELRVPRGWAGDGPLIAEGATVALEAGAFDAQGAALVGATMQVSTTGPLKVIAGGLVGSSSGGGAISVAAGARTVAIPYSVVAPSLVISVALPTAVTAQAGAEGAVVRPTVTTQQGALYGAACGWSLSDPSLSAGSDGTIPRLADQPGLAEVLRGTRAGTFSATCTIGGASATTAVTVTAPKGS
jgi:hypothetical protein